VDNQKQATHQAVRFEAEKVCVVVVAVRQRRHEPEIERQFEPKVVHRLGCVVVVCGALSRRE
jgi:hypothetical protein